MDNAKCVLQNIVGLEIFLLICVSLLWKFCCKIPTQKYLCYHGFIILILLALSPFHQTKIYLVESVIVIPFLCSPFQMNTLLRSAHATEK